MPRPPRHPHVDVPQHVIQRGNNRVRTFFCAQDRQRYLGWLRRAATECACDVHAYVLMTNHVHLLVTPREPLGIAALMQSVGRRYVRYINDRHGRTGTLWEARYRASLVSSEAYLWTCYRYIEQNPLRAGMVRQPSRYRWSSFHRNARGCADRLVVEHPLYTALGQGPDERCRAYRSLFDEPLSPAQLQEIRDDLHRCRGLPKLAENGEPDQ